MSRATRYLFVIVTWGVLIALYHAAFQPPKLRTDRFSTGWSLSNNRPAEGHSYSYGEVNQTDLPSKALEPSKPVAHSSTKAIQTASPSKALTPLKTDSRFISWLSARVPVDRVPFITIGDCKYIHALRNFRDRLEHWGYGDDLIVICLDQCCVDARDYHAYTRYIGESVAFVKVSLL
jgi:hypothetical protein